MMNRILASIELSDTDKKALIILLIVLIVLIFLLALFGYAVRATMRHQQKRADTMMHDVTVTHVVDSSKDFRRFGFKKNNRALFRDSLIPFLIFVVGMLTWVISCLATGDWSGNIFDHFGELFIHLDWADETLWVNVFGLRLLSHWPNAIDGYPTFRVEHLASYIAVALFIVAGLYYAYCCQAYLARAYRILRLSHTVYEKSLEGFRASEDVKIDPEKPIAPSD